MRDKLSDQDLVEVIKIEKDSAREFRSRRVPEWDETYLYYRNKVITNRVTQRQTANIPLMKTVIKSILKDTDDPPLLYFKNLDNDDQAELFYNEVWAQQARDNKMTIQDIMNKKNAYLFGRTFKALNIKDGKFYWEVVDPKDMLVHRFVNPAIIDSARFIAREHIYVPLSSLEGDEKYNQAEVKELKEYYQTIDGVMEGNDNLDEYVEKNDRMQKMGDDTVSDPILGETYVELTDCYIYLWDPKKQKDLLHYVCLADDRCILVKKPLYEVIGETTDEYWDNHFPFTSWGDDTERQDFWSDGIGDTIRQLNRILNSWFASMIENRTLKNFAMHFYNSAAKVKGERFVPQTFQPQPFGFYPMPGNPNDLIRKIEVGDLKDSIDEINFLITLGEKATAATSTQQGQIEQKKVTLGEIELALANAQERVKSIAVFYNDDWQEFGVKYSKMIDGAFDNLDPVETSKKGRITDKMYPRTIQPKEWRSRSGYTVEIKPIVDKTSEDVEHLQKLQVAQADMPDNKPLKDIVRKKKLEFAGLSLDETKEVLDWQKEQDRKMEEAIALQQSMALNGGMSRDDATAIPALNPAPGSGGPPALKPLAIS